MTTNFGGVDVVALQGAMVGGVTANFGGVDVVPLQGAIVVCYGWGEGDGQLRRSGRGAIARCHCCVLWLGTNFGGVDVVPLLGAVVMCYGGGGGGVTTNFGCHWRSGRGAIARCHCSVLWLGGRVTTNFGCYGGGGPPNQSTLQWHLAMAPRPLRQWHPKLVVTPPPHHSTWHPAMTLREWTWCL